MDGQKELIAYALGLSKLVINQSDAFELYVEVFVGYPERFATSKDLREVGDLLNKDELSAIGLRSNVKLSRQFFATSKDEGRTEPLDAASLIGLSISSALCIQRGLKSMEEARIETAEFNASNMASVPCQAARSRNNELLR